MNKENLERTNLMKTMMIDIDKDEDAVIESIEQFEEKLEYMDLPNDKKEKLKDLCQQIKDEENENTRDYLYRLLEKEVN